MHLANQDDYTKGVKMTKTEDCKPKYSPLAIVVILFIVILILILMGYINPDYPPPAF
jgi:hypothetical protein